MECKYRLIAPDADNWCTDVLWSDDLIAQRRHGVMSSKDGVMFNYILGTTIGVNDGGGYTATPMTAFGDAAESQPSTLNPQPLFTGKPHVDGLGHAFLFRNYRAGLGKWLTADPLGYPDGWNQLAYCNNGVMDAVDWIGGRIEDSMHRDFTSFLFKSTIMALLLVMVCSIKAEGVNSYSLHLPDRVLGELYCTFHDVRTHAYGIWWSVTGAYVDDNGIYDSSRNGWRVQSRVALDSLTVISNKIACDVGFVANMKMRQPVEFRNKGRTTRLIGSKRKVFHVTDRMAMKDHLPSFLARGERLARGKADINVLMCASGMDYFFEGQDFFHYALFLAGCKTLVFTYAIGLGDVKDVQWELHDGCIRDNIALGTVSHYDSRYSVFVCLDNQGECLDRQLTLNLQITGLHNEVVSLPISLWNVKTLSDSIRYQKADGILKWSAERKAFDITTLVF